MKEKNVFKRPKEIMNQYKVTEKPTNIIKPTNITKLEKTESTQLFQRQFNEFCYKHTKAHFSHIGR